MALLWVSPASAGLVPAVVGDRGAYLDMINKEAAAQGVPAALADAVAMVETGYNPLAVGSSGEIGMMQVMPATARQLGFSGTSADLFLPATNIHLGVQYLSRAWATSGGNVCRALMKYRAGLGEEMMTPLSITYCARAMAWLDTIGSELATGAAGVASAVAEAVQAPAPDPHVVAMFPALPEQAGLLPLVNSAPAGGAVAVSDVMYHRSMAEQSGRLQARYNAHVRPRAAAGKAAAAVEAALSEE